MTLTFAKRSKRLDLLFGIPVPVRQRLDLDLFVRLADVRQSPRSLLFDRPWSTFATAVHI